jgi:xanthine/uracil/vitamin C permease (AzgA family)
MGIIRPIVSIGAGVLQYKIVDKYGDPTYPMPWAGMPYINRVELSNLLSYLGAGIAGYLAKYGRGLSGEARTGLAEYAVTSFVMATVGLFFSPAAITVPQYVTPPTPTPQAPMKYT